MMGVIVECVCVIFLRVLEYLGGWKCQRVFGDFEGEACGFPG